MLKHTEEGWEGKFTTSPAVKLQIAYRMQIASETYMNSTYEGNRHC